MASKRAKRNFKRTSLLPKYALGGIISGRAITEEEPWKKDASGNYTGTEWDRSSTGSIIPDKPDPMAQAMKIGTIEKDEEGNLSLMGTPPPAPIKPKKDPFGSNALQPLRFAEGGRIGLRGRHGKPIEGVPTIAPYDYSKLPQPQTEGLENPYAYPAAPAASLRDSSVPLRTDYVQPQQVGRPQMERITDITSMVPPPPERPTREFTNADIGKVGPPSTAEQPVQIPSATGYTYPDKVSIPQESRTHYGSENRGFRERTSSSLRDREEPGPTKSADTKFISEMPTTPTTPALPASLRESYSLRDRDEPTGPLGPSAEDVLAKINPPVAGIPEARPLRESFSIRDKGEPTNIPQPLRQSTSLRDRGEPTGPLARSKLPPMEIVQNAAAKYGIPSAIAEAQIYAESKGNPKATGPMTKRGRSEGLAQILPSTGKEYGVVDPYDPEHASDFYGRYMKDLLRMHGGDMDQAIAAYNTGPGNLRAAKKRAEAKGTDWRTEVPKETQNYLAKIKKRAAETEATAARKKKPGYAEGGTINPLQGKKVYADDEARIQAALTKVPKGYVKDMLTKKVYADDTKKIGALVDKAKIKFGMADGGSVPKTAWGGPTEDNESTRIHSPIYKGPGGIWDGMPMFAQGGQINRKGLRGGVKDGMFYGEGGETQDKIHIRASPNEFIIPADSAAEIGPDRLRAMVAATHTPVHLRQGLRNGYANGDSIAKKLGRLFTSGKKKAADAAAWAAEQARVQAEQFRAGQAAAAQAQAAAAAAAPPPPVTPAGPAFTPSVTGQAGNWRTPRGGVPPPPQPAAPSPMGPRGPVPAGGGGTPSPGGPAGPIPPRPAFTLGPQPGLPPTPPPGVARPAGLGGAPSAAMPPFTSAAAQQAAGPTRVPPNPPGGAAVMNTPWQRAKSTFAADLAARGGLRSIAGGAMWLIDPIIEGTKAAFDIRNTDDDILKAQRVAEAMGISGTATAAGKAAWDATHGMNWKTRIPLTALAGTAGYVGGKLGIRGSGWLGGGIGSALAGEGFQPGSTELPSELIAQEKRNQPVPKYVPNQTPEQAAEFTKEAVVRAQAGQFPDRAQVQGLRGPQLPRAGEDNAVDLAPIEGGGYISGTDPETGQPRLVTYRKGDMPAPMGITDTSTPEQKAADKARRADWTAQSQAIDARMAAKEAAAARSLMEMNQQNQVRGAQYDLQQGLRNRDPAAVAAAQNTLGLIKEDRNRQALSDAKTQEAAAADTRAKMLAEAERYRADIGLRGDELKAKATADAALAAGGLKREEIERQNRLDAEADRQQRYMQSGGVDPKTGNPLPPVRNIAGEQFEDKYLTTPATANKAWLKANYGKTNYDDLTTTEKKEAQQEFAKYVKLVQQTPLDSSDPELKGLPTGMRVSELGAGDWYNSSSDPQDNAISLGQGLRTLIPKWAPFAPTPEQRTKVTMQFPDRREHAVVFDELIGKDPEMAKQVIKQVAATEGKAQALKLWQNYLRLHPGEANNPPIK